MRHAAALAVLAVLVLTGWAGCSGAAGGAPAVVQAPSPSVRLFVQVSGEPFNILRRPSPGGTVGLVEVDDHGRRITDTLAVYVQHCQGARCPVPAEAYEADMVVTCYPQNVEPVARARHAFPGWNGLVWAYGHRRTLVISAGRLPHVEALMVAAGAMDTASPPASLVVCSRRALRALHGDALAAVADLLGQYVWGEHADIPGTDDVWVSVWGPGLEPGAVYTVEVVECVDGAEAVLVGSEV